MAFVLDASVSLAWCFPDEATSFATSVLAALRGSEAVVPGIWPFEVANALLLGERRRRLLQVQVARAVELLESLPIRAEQCDLTVALGRLRTLADRQGLSVYDASYLDLAIGLSLPLATLDERLRSAAIRLGVPLFQ